MNGPDSFSSPTLRKPADVLVPAPTADPGLRTSPPPGAQRPNDDNESPFGSDGSEKTFKGTHIPKPQTDGGPQTVASTGTDSFETPVERTAAAPPGGPMAADSSKDMIPIEPKMADARGSEMPAASPYDYDRTSYSYLRGRVDFDTKTRSWQVIYNPNPDSHDPYGGAFELVEHPKLSTLHSGDFVFVQGRVNPDKMDHRNKPKYEIHGADIARITYRGNQSMAN
jgi:hypothetical protein